MDARRRQRAPYRGWVELTLGADRVRAEGCDLSVDGIGIAVKGPPPIDTSLVSEFTLPGITLPLELRGRLVWSDAGACRAGVRFESVDPGLAELLSNFVAGRL
ncbi:MAG TPA: PilZ domain-containing protein [Myxococcota bacterium]|nr:PilZ domain-containing protein [Myxococcota bacterium]